MTTDRLIPLALESAPAERRRPLWPRIRRAIFWTHLTAGCVAGLVILLLAVTGVLLTYERQLMAFVESSSWTAPPAGAARLRLDGLLETVTSDTFRPTEVTVRANSAAPVQIAAGRRDRREFDAYTGSAVAPAAPALDAFFATVTRLHRWFALEGDARQNARQITGAANLIFLFILLSGLVIWLPPLWKRVLLAPRLLFARRYASAQARDYNWHHVIGVWCVLPLLVISATATVFHYDWARDSLRWLSEAGAEPRDETAEQTSAQAAYQRAGKAGTAAAEPRSVEQLIATAAAQAAGWNRLTLTLPEASAATVAVTVDRGNGAQIQHQEQLLLDRWSGAVLSQGPRNANDPAAYARFVNRFLHTGEIFGVVGQTVAGLVSLGSAFLVWTGLALAWRRLVLRPLRRLAASA